MFDFAVKPTDVCVCVCFIEVEKQAMTLKVI